MILSVIKCCEWNIDYGDAAERRDDPPSLLRATEGRVEGIKRLDALLEYAVMHGDEAAVARLRAELTKFVEKV